MSENVINVLPVAVLIRWIVVELTVVAVPPAGFEEVPVFPNHPDGAGAVTMTGTDLAGCESTSGGGGGNTRQRCNQGVGNGPEACDPGNSNQGNPARSNDELGGVPGSPGRKR